MGQDSNAKITKWEADSDCLEVQLWIMPWERSVWYRREFKSVANSYVSRWVWLDGPKGSGLTSHSNVEVQQILVKLVRDHGTLGLFCVKYGIEIEEKSDTSL